MEEPNRDERLNVLANLGLALLRRAGGEVSLTAEEVQTTLDSSNEKSLLVEPTETGINVFLV